MWRVATDFILKRRYLILFLIIVLTTIMGYLAMQVKLSHEFVQMLPDSDPESIAYSDFRERFGEDGMVMYIAVADSRITKLNNFNAWYALSDSLSRKPGIKNVLSVGQIINLEKDTKAGKFKAVRIFQDKPSTQEELDSLLEIVYGLRFYDGLLFNKKTSSTVTALTMDKSIINSKARNAFIDDVCAQYEIFSKETGIDAHFSGLPYIRTITSRKIEREMLLFIFLALVIAAMALFLFFRSVKAVIIPMFIVCISVIWVLGLIVILGYEITVLSGIIPPLLIVIGVENCIYLLNKYHRDYSAYGEGGKGMGGTVKKIGNALMMTNLTTAIGFSTFVVTHNNLLVEFGIVASLSIMMGFILSVVLVPVFYSFVKPPGKRHLKHLDNKNMKRINDIVIFTVLKRRKLVFVLAGLLFLGGIAGISLLKTSGRIVDDIPQTDSMYLDLQFFEKHYNGILPLEIIIDTKKKHGLKQMKHIEKIDALQEVLSDYDCLSRSMSVADLLKFARQAFYNGNPERYGLPSRRELGFILKYAPDISSGTGLTGAFTDSLFQIARVSVQMSNMTTIEMTTFRKELEPRIDSIFSPEAYEVVMTGGSMVFLKGTSFLVHNLMVSLAFAIFLIGLLMALVFRSYRMILVSMLPNLLPQLLTAAMMGFAGIPIKPSTILIFSIAFGISVDNTIHFLAKYRIELKKKGLNVKECVVNALRETGVSMIYSSIVLFFGFAIFMASSFGGTQALGFLISFTLLTALFSNLFILPSILLSWENRITTRAFYREKALIEIEQED